MNAILNATSMQERDKPLLEISIISIVLILDQVTKYLSERYLALGASSPVIQGVFQFTNVHNTGAAWGMLAGGRWLFIVITLVTVGLLCWLLLRRRKTLGFLARLCVALLIAGATGNLIDRVLIGYVRDMFDFCLINFPVFNVADCAVSVGAALLVIDTLFTKHGSLLSMLEQKERKTDTGREIQPSAAHDADAPENDSQRKQGNGNDA